MSTPLVSVIIIFLNAERFIEEAVRSVFDQTYRRWELLLVDDGSTDASTSIARRFASSFPDRVRYLEHAGHENRGMSASRNLGVRASSGEYVALLDADDVWLRDKLERQVPVLAANPDAAMVYGRTEWWYSWTGKADDQGRDFVHELGVASNTPISPPRLLARFLTDEGISPCTCSMLIRREAFERVGGFEEQFRGLYEDQVFSAKVCLEATVVALEECSYRYRQHPDSALHVAERNGTTRTARAEFLGWLSAYLASRDSAHGELRTLVEREQARLHRRPSSGLRPRVDRLRRALRAAATRLLGSERRDT